MNAIALYQSLKRAVQNKITRHNEEVLLRNGFQRCDGCRKLVLGGDRYCQYCGACLARPERKR